MKKGRLLVIVGILIILLCGCSGHIRKDYDTTTLILQKDGGVAEFIVEDFDKEYYSVDELNQLVQKSIDDYNANVGQEDAVVLNYFEKDEASASIKVAIVYKNASDYQKMNGRDLFVGTISEAKAAGYEIEDLAPLGDNSGAKKVSDLSNETVVISSEPIDVEGLGKVIMGSSNVSVKSEKIASIGESDTYSVVVFE